MERIYCISGLGADARVFNNLKIAGAELVPVSWPHYDQHDDMACYAQKLIYQINDKEPTIIGVSFGGMLSVEIAKQVKIKKAFLVSSAKTQFELPHVGKFVRRLANMHIIPVGLFKHFHKPMYDRFGVTKPDEKKLMQSIMNDTDNGFVKWAMNALINWRNDTIPENIVHIHGTIDKMIPPENVKPNYWIENGTHFMVYNRADEISAIITKHLNS